MDHLEKGTLDLTELRFLVLDEADEMLNMGFADDVETILADTPDTKQVALFSATMPAPMVSQLFSQIAEELASEYSSQIQGMNMEERLEFVKELLAQEGFTVEWEKKGSEYQIHEISCPYYQIGVAHPEVCTVDQTLISKMLALPANKVQCILDGGSHCTYVVQPTPVKN